MPFSTRNAYYLRASNYRVLPLFLYLDERHTDWMSDRILQQVIAALQPKMRDLLELSRDHGYTHGGTGPAGGDKKKRHKVYVERGEGYQYCYFLRTTTRTEVVLLKQKTYSLRPPTPPPAPVPAPQQSASPLRSRSASTRQDRQSRTRSRSISARPTDLEDDGNQSMLQEGENGEEEEEEDRKPDLDEMNIKDYKPDVSLKYKGFGTSSLQLVLIVEPYPPLPSSEYAPPSSRLSTRSASVASSYSRSRTGGSRATGAGSRVAGSRYSSIAPSMAPMPAPFNAPNMRNASRSASATPIPNSRRGGSSVTPALGTSVTPFRDASSTPGPGASDRRGGTPLFYPRDTPFDQDEEDELAHSAYLESLREGRVRLPSVSRPAGFEAGMSKSDRKRAKARLEREEEDEVGDDEPEGMESLGQRLVRSSQLEEGVVRVQGGWEERAEGEESAVLGREEPGD